MRTKIGRRKNSRSSCTALHWLAGGWHYCILLFLAEQFLSCHCCCRVLALNAANSQRNVYCHVCACSTQFPPFTVNLDKAFGHDSSTDWIFLNVRTLAIGPPARAAGVSAHLLAMWETIVTSNNWEVQLLHSSLRSTWDALSTTGIRSLTHKCRGSQFVGQLVTHLIILRERFCASRCTMYKAVSVHTCCILHKRSWTHVRVNVDRSWFLYRPHARTTQFLRLLLLSRLTFQTFCTPPSARYATYVLIYAPGVPLSWGIPVHTVCRTSNSAEIVSTFAPCSS